MRQAPALRPELGSVCRFVAVSRQARTVRRAPRDTLRGVLADLADGRGRH
jgi:hypothetical protein